MKNLIWSFFAIAFVGMLTLSSCGDGGAAERAAKKEKMEADSIANAMVEAKMKFEAETKGAITRLDRQIEQIKSNMAEATDEAKTEMTAKMGNLQQMRDKLNENLNNAMKDGK